MNPRMTRIYTNVCFVAFRDDSWFQEKDLRKQIGLALAQVILETMKDTNLHEYMDAQSLKETQAGFSNCFVAFHDNSWFQENNLRKQIGLALAQVILETTKDTNLHEYMDVQSLKETQTDFSNCFVGFRDNSWFQEKDLWKQIIN